MLNCVYESNPWENVIPYTTMRLHKVRPELEKRLEGFKECTPKAKIVIEDLFLLTHWYRNMELSFKLDSMEIISELENENLGSKVKEYIEQLCNQLGGE